MSITRVYRLLYMITVLRSGRRYDADALARELGVSRRHLLLRPTNRLLYVTDLGSTNGTFVDGKRIWKEISHPLDAGNRLTLSSFILTVSTWRE